MNITLDEGFSFGLGVFETIAIEEKKAIFLSEHLKRMTESAKFLNISLPSEKGIIKEKIEKYVLDNCEEHSVLKIMLSKENVVFQTRKNNYQPMDYERGFELQYSTVKRNETSPLVYHKTMNYGDCILEKRAAAKNKIDEMIFLNTKGQISEGTISNIFFVKHKKIYTPSVACGLLPGIMRKYICDNNMVLQCEIYPEEVEDFEECFITNSLMGIMPVKKLQGKVFSSRELTNLLIKKYKEKNKFFDSFN